MYILRTKALWSDVIDHFLQFSQFQKKFTSHKEIYMIQITKINIIIMVMSASGQLQDDLIITCNYFRKLIGNWLSYWRCYNYNNSSKNKLLGLCSRDFWLQPGYFKVKCLKMKIKQNGFILKNKDATNITILKILLKINIEPFVLWIIFF